MNVNWSDNSENITGAEAEAVDDEVSSRSGVDDTSSNGDANDSDNN